MADARKYEQMETVADAARRYRDAMRRYIADQAELMERGLSADDLVTSNWEGYAQVAEAEEELFAILDALDRAGQNPS